MCPHVPVHPPTCPYVSYAAVIFIAVGAVAFVVGFLGCCGALKEQPSCLFSVS